MLPLIAFKAVFGVSLGAVIAWGLAIILAIIGLAKIMFWD